MNARSSPASVSVSTLWPVTLRLCSEKNDVAIDREGAPSSSARIESTVVPRVRGNDRSSDAVVNASPTTAANRAARDRVDNRRA
jgi:hypothetical protein